MTKICGYNCEFNKSGICQITGCAKRIYVANRTTNKEDNYKQALNEIRKYIYRNRKEYSNYVGAEKDWLYIQDKNILQIIDKYMKGD